MNVPKPSAGSSDDILDSLSAHIAVLDSRGVVVSVNESWRRFVRENNGAESDYFIGANYLAVLEAAIQCGDETANAVLDGVTSVLAGEREEFSLEYPCHSPDQERWFAMHVTPGRHGGAIIAHENITARKQAENALRETEQMLRQVLETLPVGVWIMDRSGRIVHGNQAGRRIWGGARYVGPDRFGEYKGWWSSTGKSIAAHEWAAARAIREGETSIDEEVRIECFDGSEKVILNSAVPLRDARHRITGAIIVNQDISTRKNMEQELRSAKEDLEVANRELQQAFDREQRIARTDDLTGISNRRHFLDIAEHEFAVSQRYGHPLSVILFDIDRFKQLNDTFGHLAGDISVKSVALAADRHRREVDVVARYGGDEFIMLLPDSNANEAATVAERIRREVATCDVAAGAGPGITISAGIAEVLVSQDTLDDLIRRADQALYAAKSAGRNRAICYGQPFDKAE